DVIVFEARSDAGLAEKAGLGLLLLGDLRKHHLQGDSALKRRVLRLEDDAHASLAQNLQDAVTLQPTDFIRLLWRGQEGGTELFEACVLPWGRGIGNDQVSRFGRGWGLPPTVPPPRRFGRGKTERRG